MLWGSTVATWVDDELADLPNPVIVSLQREFTDPVLLATTVRARRIASLHNCHCSDPEVPRRGIREDFRPVLAPFQGIDELLRLTEQQRSELVRDAPGAAVRAVPHPRRPAREEPQVEDPDLVVLVGQLIDRERIDHAITAVVEMVRRRSTARLEVYGEGPEEARLRDLIARLGLEGSVRLMGYSLAVGEVKARAACTVMTSTSAGGAREVTERLPVEAWERAHLDVLTGANAPRGWTLAAVPRFALR